MKKVVVISLGGSLIISEKVNFEFLDNLKKILRKNYGKYKFVIVCGGGSVARKYIYLLEKENKSRIELSKVGIRATRSNAQLMMQFFGKEANDKLPLNMVQVKDNLHKNSVVFCGALRFTKNSTSDTTAAKLAHFLNSLFINLTNVKGLYSSDPRKNKDAKFIPYISWKDFEKMANKIKYKAGQHFVLDQNASHLIRKNKILAYIIGENIINLQNVLEGKKFLGTLIKD